MTHESLVAYFSMEIGLDSLMPTYAGGLGVLAGDTLRSAADIEFPMVAVTLLHRHGYFYQRFDSQGWQTEEPVAWPINDFLDPVDTRVTVDVEGRKVAVSAWRYEVKGLSGFVIPVYLLDTLSASNAYSQLILRCLLVTIGFLVSSLSRFWERRFGIASRVAVRKLCSI